MGVLKFFPKPELQQDYNNADYAAMWAVWGNGNADNGFATVYALTMLLAHDRDTHPVFAKNAYEALEVIDVEFNNLEYAIEHESERKQKDASLNLAVTAIRFAGGEHLALPEGKGSCDAS